MYHSLFLCPKNCGFFELKVPVFLLLASRLFIYDANNNHFFWSRPTLVWFLVTRLRFRSKVFRIRKYSTDYMHWTSCSDFYHLWARSLNSVSLAKNFNSVLNTWHSDHKIFILFAAWPRSQFFIHVHCFFRRIFWRKKNGNFAPG